MSRFSLLEGISFLKSDKEHKAKGIEHSGKKSLLGLVLQAVRVASLTLC
jgi:hypothetical protein